MERSVVLLSIVLASLFAIGIKMESQTPTRIEKAAKWRECSEKRYELEKKSGLSNFGWYMIDGIGLNSGFYFNDMTAGIPELGNQYNKLYPEITLKGLFGAPKGAKCGLEVSGIFANAPTIQGRSNIFKLGLISGSVSKMTHHLHILRTSSLGYMRVYHHIRNLPDADDVKARSRGLYANINGAVLIPIRHNQGFGISLGLDVYYLWGWDYAQGTPLIPGSRPGWGLIPTIGIVGYMGGL